MTDEALSVEAIAEVVNGEGHFLGAGRTLELMEADYVYPELADRRSIEEWTESSDQDLRSSARQRLFEILRMHYPAVVTPEDDARIRTEFNILLSQSSMRPGDGRW